MAAALRWMAAARRTRAWRADATHGSGGAEADGAQRVDAEASPSLRHDVHDVRVRYTKKSSLMMPLLLIILVVAAASTTVARSAWVGDYASNHGCGETAAAELCDPGDPAANRACNDACYYNGCRGGRCILLYRGYLDGGDGSGGGRRGIGRGCHCR
uniref:Uncharacterized protein n=1 Tax=Oryza meridionalis TaxID=40149 RepID=A0A0E0CU21_9ORYZ